MRKQGIRRTYLDNRSPRNTPTDTTYPQLRWRTPMKSPGSKCQLRTSKKKEKSSKTSTQSTKPPKWWRKTWRKTWMQRWCVFLPARVHKKCKHDFLFVSWNKNKLLTSHFSLLTFLRQPSWRPYRNEVMSSWTSTKRFLKSTLCSRRWDMEIIFSKEISQQAWCRKMKMFMTSCNILAVLFGWWQCNVLNWKKRYHGKKISLSPPIS